MNITKTEPLHLFYFSVRFPFTFNQTQICKIMSSVWNILTISQTR